MHTTQDKIIEVIEFLSKKQWQYMKEKDEKNEEINLEKLIQLISNKYQTIVYNPTLDVDSTFGDEQEVNMLEYYGKELKDSEFWVLSEKYINDYKELSIDDVVIKIFEHKKGEIK